MNNLETQVLEEIWSGCGEQLELIHPAFWNMSLVPVLIRMIAKQRDDIKYLKKINEMANR